MSRLPLKVAFLCVHNAGRSQIANAFFNEMADPAIVRATCAGTEPVSGVHPEVVTVMKEVGIDLTRRRPRLLIDEVIDHATLVVTMGCGEACPVVPGAVVEEWEIEDPKGKDVETVRRIRDEIRDRVKSLIEDAHWGRTADASRT